MLKSRLDRWLLSLALAACTSAEDAKRVELPVVVDGSRLVTVTTDLGYEVELESVSIAIEDLTFSSAGEAHAALWERVSQALIPLAHAHPGHYQAGEITGELLGALALEFAPQERTDLGVATLLVRSYRSANFTFTRAESGESIAGHTARLTGVASSADAAYEFEILLDSPEARELIGIPFDVEVTESSPQALALQFLPLDPVESDTLFDGVDFAALDSDGDGSVSIQPDSSDAPSLEAYNALRRAFQSHDHYMVTAITEMP
jgi:hypothetical protein